MRLPLAWLGRHVELPPTEELAAELDRRCVRVHRRLPGEVFEFENRSLHHRPDLWGVAGFAREVAGLFARSLREPQLESKAGVGPGPEIYDHSKGAVRRFAAAWLYGCRPLDPQRQALLAAAGPRAAGEGTLLATWVTLEMGHPIHLLPADDLVTPLHLECLGTPLEVPSGNLSIPQGTLILRDDRGSPLALPGILTLAPPPGPDTRRCLAVAVCPRPDVVAPTTSRLRLHTEASRRAERGPVPAAARQALDRLLHLAAPEGFSKRSDSGGEEELRRLFLDWPRVQGRLGVEVARETVGALLGPFGFRCEVMGETGVRITVPPWRADPGSPEGVVLEEEICRLLSVDRLPSRPLSGAIEARPRDPLLAVGRGIRQALALRWGCTEIRTPIWDDRRWLRRLGFTPRSALTVTNPLAASQGSLKVSPIPDLLRLARKQRGRRLRWFEVAPAFSAEEGEVPVLGGLLVEPGVHLAETFYTACEIFRWLLALPPERREPPSAEALPAEAPWVDPEEVWPGRLAKAVIGRVAPLPPPLPRRWFQGASVVTLELDLRPFLGADLAWRPPPPAGTGGAATTADLNVEAPPAIGPAGVLRALESAPGIVGVDLLEVEAVPPRRLPAGTRYLFRLALESADPPWAQQREEIARHLSTTGLEVP